MQAPPASIVMAQPNVQPSVDLVKAQKDLDDLR